METSRRAENVVGATTDVEMIASNQSKIVSRSFLDPVDPFSWGRSVLCMYKLFSFHVTIRVDRIVLLIAHQ